MSLENQELKQFKAISRHGFSSNGGVIMADTTTTICPECKGEKKIPGICVCDMEWRGSQKNDEWDDCQCTEEEICPACLGTGFVSGN